MEAGLFCFSEGSGLCPFAVKTKPYGRKTVAE